MASSVGLKVSQDEVLTLRAHKANASTRLESSRKVATACEHFEVNGQFFEVNRSKIEKLVKDMSAASSIVDKLVSQNGEAGTAKITRTQPGRFFGQRKVTKEEGLAEVTAEIQGNLNKEVVVIGLRTLGILPTPKAPIFTLPEAPSRGTVAKAAAGVTGAVAAGAAYVYRDEIGAAAVTGYASLPQSVQDFGRSVAQKAKEASESVMNNMPAMPSMPSMPSMDEVKTFATTQYDNASIHAKNAKNFVIENPGKVALGAGAAALVIGGGVAAYKIVQNRRKQAQETVAQTPAQQAPVDDKAKAS